MEDNRTLLALKSLLHEFLGWQWLIKLRGAHNSDPDRLLIDKDGEGYFDVQVRVRHIENLNIMIIDSLYNYGSDRERDTFTVNLDYPNAIVGIVRTICRRCGKEMPNAEYIDYVINNMDSWHHNWSEQTPALLIERF